MQNFDKCPFKVGDIVVYRPSQHGWGYEVMWPLDERLVPGREYVVREVQNDTYVVVDQPRHPPGGIVWTEFRPSA